MSAHIFESQDISNGGKLVVSFRVLLSLYAIIPLCFLLQMTDVWFWHGYLRESLPTKPTHFLLFQILFKIQHLSWTNSREQRFQIPTPCCEVGVFFIGSGPLEICFGSGAALCSKCANLKIFMKGSQISHTKKFGTRLYIHKSLALCGSGSATLVWYKYTVHTTHS